MIVNAPHNGHGATPEDDASTNAVGMLTLTAVTLAFAYLPAI